LAVRYFEKTVNDEDLLLATAGPVVSLYGTLLELEQESDETGDNLLEIAERVYAFCLKGRFEPGADISTAAIPENAAVIAFFRTPSAVLAWHVTRSGVSVFRLNDSDRAPRRFEDDVRAILDDPAVSVAPLSKVLLAPLLPHLKGVERIAVVPHAYLHDVPWAELFATEGINARVTLAPTVEFALQPRFDGLSPQPPVLALVGDKPGPGWPPLPGTAIEAERTVAAAEGRVVRGAAGIAALRSSTPRFLHVSAHTTLNPARPSRSGFILGPGQDDFLSARNIKELDLRGVSAVTVGGCSAARSVPLGAQTFSLVRPFLQAGATAVFGSLIPVDDQDSPPVFEAIYRGLGKGLVLSEAVALASKLHPGPLVRRGVTYASLYE
jgi:CHAT domain-containing protein